MGEGNWREWVALCPVAASPRTDADGGRQDWIAGNDSVESHSGPVRELELRQSDRSRAAPPTMELLACAGVRPALGAVVDALEDPTMELLACAGVRRHHRPPTNASGPGEPRGRWSPVDYGQDRVDEVHSKGSDIALAER